MKRPSKAGLLLRRHTRVLIASLAAALAALSLVPTTIAAAWPEHVEHWMNDFSGLLKPGEREALDTRLRDLETRTTNQVVVAIFPSLEGEDRDDLTNRLFKAWKIGQKGKDNGVLLTIFVQDRKTKIEVGYGVEALLTDAISARILRDDLAPAFREGRYADGISAAIDDIAAAITTGEVPQRRQARRGKQGSGLAAMIVILIIVVLIFMTGGGGLLGALLGASMTANRGGWSRGRGGWGGGMLGGGGWGGGGGGGGWGGGGGGGFSGGGGMSGGGGAGGGW